MGLFRGRPASLARLGAAALTVITAVAVLRAGQAVQTPPPPGQQAPPATQQAPPAGQQQPAQQQPVFRAGVKLVRVDVTVTGKGDLPVADLTPADFEVAEDGAPQKVEQLQFVRLDGQRPAGDETSLEIRSQDQAEAEAARDDVRVFAIFFDDYHVDKAPQITIPMRQGLTLFINRLWPSDLVAIMDPLTTLSALRFTRSKSELQAAVNKFEGRQGEIFPVKSVMEEAQLMRGDIRRVRAQVTFSALAALTMKLGGMREGRKSIIFVSQGPPTYLGARDGNLQDEMRTIVEAANRGNVAIYPLDPTGLSMEMRRGRQGHALPARRRDRRPDHHQHQQLRRGPGADLRGQHRVLRPRLHADADRGRREVPQDHREGEAIGHARAREAGLLRAEFEGARGGGGSLGEDARAPCGRRARHAGAAAAGQAARRRVGGDGEGRGRTDEGRGGVGPRRVRQRRPARPASRSRSRRRRR